MSLYRDRGPDCMRCPHDHVEHSVNHGCSVIGCRCRDTSIAINAPALLHAASRSRIDDRDPECVESWPECFSGEYDPRCCRFPKSCSA